MGLAMISLIIASPIVSFIELLGVESGLAAEIGTVLSAPLILVALVLCVPLALVGGALFSGAGLISSLFSWMWL